MKFFVDIGEDSHLDTVPHPHYWQRMGICWGFPGEQFAEQGESSKMLFFEKAVRCEAEGLARGDLLGCQREHLRMS